MGPFRESWTEADVDRVLQRGLPSELLYVPIVVGMNADACEEGWPESICLSLVDHPDPNVRGNALTGLGHIARINGRLCTDEAMTVISRGLADPDEEVRGKANDAASDIEIYLGITVQGYDGKATQDLLAAIEELRRKHGI